MKKFLILIYLISVINFISCEDELYQEPVTSKVSSNFYSTEEEIEEAVNAVYSSLRKKGLYNLYLPALGEISSDNTFDEVPANDDGIYGQLDEFTTITSNSIVEATWEAAYIGIQWANIVLNRIPDVNFDEEDVKDNRIGEVKFIRALLYFNLVRLYGDVPLVVEETTDPNDYFGQGRTASSEVYKQIETDLKEAIEVLPDEASEEGRVIKTAGQALLAKVYLTEGDLSSAKTLLETVYNSEKHSLLGDVNDIFDIDNEGNEEIIFAVQFVAGLNGNSMGSSAFQQFSPSGTVSGAKGHSLPTVELYNSYSSNDLRKTAYVGITDENVPYTKKLTEPSTEPADGGSDWVVLRFADVVLLLAEIEAGQNNLTVASGYLNEIRNRAGLPDTQASTQEEMIDSVAFERRLELVSEGHRWFDLLRYGTAVTVMNNWFAAQGDNITIDDHDLLLPIPQSQIDTDPSITQNDGY